jgi:hypothetical protein
MADWYILWPFRYIFSRFGMLYQEKSDNPAPEHYIGDYVPEPYRKI